MKVPLNKSLKVMDEVAASGVSILSTLTQPIPVKTPPPVDSEPDTTSAPGTEDEAAKTGVSDVDRKDLIAPLNKEDFKALWDDATTLAVFSSDGELSDIANRELKRVTSDPGPGDVLRQAMGEFFRGKGERLDETVVVKSETDSEGEMFSTAPLLSDWPGNFQFRLVVPASGKAREPQYSRHLNKLYIAQNKALTLLLSTAGAQPSDLSMRAAMVFTSSDHFKDPVKVCYQHSHTGAGVLRDGLAPHILRLTAGEPLADVKYLHHPESGRNEVVVSPLPPPSPGVGHVPITVRFTDLSSCPGGINRRETAVVFTLEQEGQGVVGRKVMPVRVCTCPKRDREHDEKERLGGSRGQGKRPPPMEELEGEQGEGQFWVLATDRDNYEALVQVGAVMEKRKGGNMAEYKEANERFNKRKK